MHKEQWSLTGPREPTLARFFMCKSNLILIHCWVNWRWRQSQINFASTRFDQFPDQSIQRRKSAARAHRRNTFCRNERRYDLSPMPQSSDQWGVKRQELTGWSVLQSTPRIIISPNRSKGPKKGSHGLKSGTFDIWYLGRGHKERKNKKN